MTTTQRNPYLQPPPYESSINPWLIRIPLLFITGVFLLMMLLIVLVGAFRASYEGKITPGISALGVELGGMTRDEAVAVLRSQFTYDQNTVFRLSSGGNVWDITAAELGVTFDVEATVERAFAISHDEDALTDLFDQAVAWFNGEAIAPIVRYDQGKTLEKLHTIAASLDQPAQNASLILDGLNIHTSPAQIGRVVDVSNAIAALESHITALADGAEIPLTIHESYPTIWNVDETANQLRMALSGPLELYAETPEGARLGPWTISVEQIAALLRLDLVDQPDGTQTYSTSIDMSAFEGYLQQLAPGLIVAPRDGRFHFDEVSRQLVVVRPAVNGRALNIPETLRQLEQAVFRYEGRSVPMAFDYTLPRYHNNITAAELGITQLVGESTTYYTGSDANRRHNISHGASLFDGIIIGPGEEFSFNWHLGDISLETGFLEGKVIVAERTVSGIGGGICQVSTTIFRAAFFGGFPIIERNTHAYRVGYYELNGSPPGLDAAIWTPERDFRFQNDTDYHLLLQTTILPADNSIQFRLYSTNPGRVVEVQEPTIRNIEPALATKYEPNADLQPGQINQVDYAAEGADVNIKRIIRDLDGNIIDETNIFTHYFPWAAIFEVAPSDARLNGL